MPDDELLNPVLPGDPGGNPHRLTDRVHAGVGELLRRQRPRLPSSPTRHLSHDLNTIEQTYEPRQECTTEPSGRWARGSGRSGSTMPVDRPQEDEARAETGQ
jgi:hypothetical protein